MLTARTPAIDLRIALLVGLVALVLLFDGRNVRLVILFHVTNYVTYIFSSCYFLIKASQSPLNFGTKYSELYFRRHKLRFPCSAASVAAHFAPLCLLFPQNLAAQSFAGALKVESFCLPFYGVTFSFYGGLVVVCLLITFLPKLYFPSLTHTEKGGLR